MKLKLPKPPDGFLHRCPVLSTLGISFSLSASFVVFLMVIGTIVEKKINALIVFEVVLTALYGMILLSPIILSCYNLFYLVVPGLSDKTKAAGRRAEYFTLIYGGALSWIWGSMGAETIRWNEDWTVQQYEHEIHQPFHTDELPTLITVAAVALGAYAILRILHKDQIPPLLTVICIGGIYLGIALCVAWIIHFLSNDSVLCVFPGNLILIFAKVIKDQVEKWRREEHEVPQGKSKFIVFLHRLLSHSVGWNAFGFILALPMLGITVLILTLFGQAPDSIIRVWTETADWTFSQQVPPADLPYDLHYLCTVAAGGHRNVVKPIREGKRHGHKVLVNRQLCIANAFEQLLEERMPRFHRSVRRFYDKHGYPIAKHIRSPYAADAVWLLMKPAEWLFLAVLYLCDAKPENRIAVQYPHSPAPEWR